MEDDFAWTWQDNLRAVFGHCLPCFQPHSTGTSSADPLDDPGRGRDGLLFQNDELESLLQDPSSDSDAMSLHSNFGRNPKTRRRTTTRRKKKGKKSKNVRLWGWDLFGKQRAIALSDDDDDEGGDDTRSTSAFTTNGTAHSSDVEPLDLLSDSRIAELSSRFVPPLTDDQLRLEEEEEREREARREARRLKKEMKKAALALYTSPTTSSAPHHPHVEAYQWSPAAAVPNDDEFGEFEQVRKEDIEEDEELDGADFGAASYVRRNIGGGRSKGGSNSNSNSSTGGARFVPLPPSVSSEQPSPSSLMAPVVVKKKKRSKKSTLSSTTATSSEALPSPVDRLSPSISVHINISDGLEEGIDGIVRPVSVQDESKLR